MESPSFDDRSAALAVAHGMVSLLRAFAAADEGDFQPLHLWSTVNGRGDLGEPDPRAGLM